MLDTETDYGAYILGLLWGTMARCQEGFWLRHRDRFFVQTVREQLQIPIAIQETSSRTGKQYRLKIVRYETVAQLQKLLTEYGWTPRNAPRRLYPQSPVNDRGFIRAWVELHGSVDIRSVKKRDRSHTTQKRLRIYGNTALITEINYILCSATGLSIRSLQKTANEITKGLYFQGKSVDTVLKWLYHDATIYNPTVCAHFQI